mgnify:CR=1 FL=1
MEANKRTTFKSPIPVLDPPSIAIVGASQDVTRISGQPIKALQNSKYAGPIYLVNPKYQDRNYAGVFITWDRMFGTFVREEEEPVYGITHPLAHTAEATGSGAGSPG